MLLRKTLMVAISIVIGVVGLVWLFYAIGFGFFGLLGFFTEVSEKGFRVALCGSSGCSNTDFSISVSWLLGMIFIIYILPIAISINFVRKRKKGN